MALALNKLKVLFLSSFSSAEQSPVPKPTPIKTIKKPKTIKFASGHAIATQPPYEASQQSPNEELNELEQLKAKYELLKTSYDELYIEREKLGDEYDAYIEENQKEIQRLKKNNRIIKSKYKKQLAYSRNMEKNLDKYKEYAIVEKLERMNKERIQKANPPPPPPKRRITPPAWEDKPIPVYLDWEERLAEEDEKYERKKKEEEEELY